MNNNTNNTSNNTAIFYTLEGVNLEHRSTHGFIAHADEVVAEVMLRTLYGATGTCSRINTRNEEEMESHTDDFLFDCGGGLFDHHSPADKDIRYKNGIILSAAGKIMEAAVNDGRVSRFVADYILAHGLYSLEAQDNGQDTTEFHRPFQCISLLSEKDSDFETLVSFATTIFNKLVADGEALEANAPKFESLASTSIKEGILHSEHMDGFGELACAWNEHHENEKIIFHIFPSIRGGFMGETVKLFSGSYKDILSFSQEDKEATDDAIFIHPSGFLCHAETEKGVVKMCRSAMQRRA